MNYIKQLQKDLKCQEDLNIDMINKINELRRHLNTDKFKHDTTIQVSDVHRWLYYITDTSNELITN